MQFMSGSMVELSLGLVVAFLERECIPVKDDKSPLDVVYVAITSVPLICQVRASFCIE